MGEFIQTPRDLHRDEIDFDDWVKKLTAKDIIMLGYADDRGIERNGGRMGAADGPDHIRDHFAKSSPMRPLEKSVICDLGNLKTWSFHLPAAHEEARKAIRLLRARGCRVISLGGGHDWAYSDFADFGSLGTPAKKTMVLNVDAHLDVRPNPVESTRSGHSGTPFRRILESATRPSKICALGLQRHCNAHHHIVWAEANEITTLFLEEFPSTFDSQWELILNRFGLPELNDKGDWVLGLSIDMDAFAQSVSPGVSAPQALGVDPNLMIKFIGWAAPHIAHLGIYETSPRLDRDDATSRLAARFVHEYVTALIS